MSNNIVLSNGGFDIIEQVVMTGDLSRLDSPQRVAYYNRVCESLGLNPYTRPFDYITLNGKLTLYAKKDATEQLRKIHGISIVRIDGQFADDLYVCTATASARDGRTDQAIGAVSVTNLKGEAKANAIMKAETKAKRRVTLSIAGLGWSDETEVEQLPGASVAQVDTETGEILRSPGRVLSPSYTPIPATPPSDSTAPLPPRVAEWLNADNPAAAAKAWAVESKSCANDSEARNSLKKIVDAHGGKLTNDNLPTVLLAFWQRQQEKINAELDKINIAPALDDPGLEKEVEAFSETQALWGGSKS